MRAAEPCGLGGAWTMIEELWRATVSRAMALPKPLLHERVDGEWSFTETIRHLVFATDCCLFRMIRQTPRPYHRWGLAGSWPPDPASLGIDPDASPSLSEVLQVRRGRMDAVRDAIAAVTADDLKRICVSPASPGHPAEAHSVLHCPSPDTGTYSRDDQEHLPAAAMGGRGRVTWNERRQDERRLTEAHPLTRPSSPG